MLSHTPIEKPLSQSMPGGDINLLLIELREYSLVGLVLLLRLAWAVGFAIFALDVDSSLEVMHLKELKLEEFKFDV